jgi:hypothetical protein
MLRDETAIGVIAVSRFNPGLFPDKQVKLLQTFSEQAVIADRERPPVHRARGAQPRPERGAGTADGDGGRAQSDQPFSVRPAERSRHPGPVGGKAVRGRHGVRDAAEGRQQSPLSCGEPWLLTGVVRLYANLSAGTRSRNADRAHFGRGPIQFTSPTFWQTQNTPRVRRRASAAIRTMLGVPLLREGSIIGVFLIARRAVKPFS